MSKKLTLSVFFPAYNEEANIEDSVKQATNVLVKLTDEYEIIIVNDGSKDRTGQIADSLAKSDQRVKVVHHSPNQGYGAAVWSGIQAAKYDYVFFTDADLQFDLAELEKLLPYIPKYKVVIGYRAKRRDPFMRLANAKGWNILNRLLFGLKVKDIDCAFKLFAREVIQNLPLKSRGAMLSAELLIRLQRQGIKFKEVPVRHLPRKAGSPTGAKPSVILRAFKELLLTYRGDLGNVTHRQAVKFMIVGASNTLFDLLLYLILTRGIPFFATHFVTAKVLSYGLSSISSFIFNRTWTFRRKQPLAWNEILRFYVTVGLALLINGTSMYTFVHVFRIPDLLAAFLATGISFVWNFVVSKFWVFTTTHKSIKSKIIPPSDLLFLLIIIGTIFAGMMLWLRVDNYPPHWDMANHLRHSLEYSDTFSTFLHGDSIRERLRALSVFFVEKETYYPPFAYWVSVPFILALGRTFTAAVFSNVVFLAILTFSVYGIGRHLWNRTTALLAVLVIVTYPFIAGQFHEFQLDMPLTAMTAAAVWCLLKTERWNNPLWSFIFGGVLGLGMLTKWPILAFLTGPVLYELVGRVREIQKQPGQKKGVVELVMSLLWAAVGLLLVAGPWYISHAESLKNNFAINWNTGTGEGDPSPLSAESLRLYPLVLIQSHIRLLMLIPLLVGLITTFLRKENVRRNGILLAWLLGGYIVMTLYNNKDYRFIEPVSGALALLTVYWISQLVQPWKALAAFYIVLVAVFQFLSVGWGSTVFPTIPPKVVTAIPGVPAKEFTLLVYVFDGYGSGPPRQGNWRQEDILDKIVATNPTRDNERATIAMYYVDQPFFNRENLNYAIAQRQLPLAITPPDPATFYCGDIDYMIATDRKNIAERVAQEFAHYEAYSLTHPQRYQETPLCALNLIYQTTLPNNDGVFVWQIIRPPKSELR